MRNVLKIILMASILTMLAAAAGCDGTTPQVNEVDLVKSALSRDMTPSADGIVDTTAANSDFAFDLYHQLVAENQGANLFISPHSVSLALAMAYAGAKGQTATQMASMLGFGADDAATHESFNALDLELDKRGTETLEQGQEGDPFELSVVNQAWGDTHYEFLETYLDVLAVNYGAGMRLLDFLGDPDGSRVTINDWVALETHDRILDLLPAGSITAATALVLTNVIYFKASWLDEFDPENTKTEKFTKIGGEQVDVDMMHKYDTLDHGIGTDYEYLLVPYVGEKVAMALILPDSGKFAEVEASMDGAAFRAMIAGASEASGNLGLPKFTFEFESSLNSALKALGMDDAFEAGIADFSGIDGIPGNLFISLVQHKSFVAVDEEGTEAAAATAVVFVGTSAPVDTFNMTFDRPFMFAIVDRPTGALLFLGRVMDPTAE